METDVEEMVRYARHCYGYHGGVGDPPSDEVIRPIVISAIEHLGVIQKKIKEDK